MRAPVILPSLAKAAGRSARRARRHRVEDDGPGIRPEDRDRVFKRFCEVETGFLGQVPGAGLGLTIVRATSEADGRRQSGVQVSLQLSRDRLGQIHHRYCT